MDGRGDRDGLFSGVDTGEDMSSLENTWESLVDLLGRQMVQMEVDVILLGSDTTSLENFKGHGSRDNITRSQILDVRGVSLHEALTFTVSEDTTFTTAALSHEATGTVNTSGMELDELGILNGETSSGNHTTTVSSASMGTCAGLVSSTISTSGHNSSVSLHSVNGSVSHVVGHDSAALVTLHNEVHGEVLDEEDTVVAEGTSEERVEHGVTGTIGNGAASVSLTSLAVVNGLTAEGSLVNLAFASSGEGHTVGFELTDGDGSLSGHVLNGILVTEPVGSLDSVIEVISPVILVHVTEGGVDSTLSGDGMRPSGEQLRNASGLETSLGKSEGGSETGTTSSDDDGIILMINDGVVTDTALTLYKK